MLNQQNPKTVGVSAIMNNPKLSKIIGDALNSTPGSSIREKAASMLRSINRNDGQGGGGFSGYGYGQPPYLPGMSSQQQSPTPQQSQPPQQSPMAGYGETTPDGRWTFTEQGWEEAAPPELPSRTSMFPAPPAAKAAPVAPSAPLPEAPPTTTGEETGDYYEDWYAGLSDELKKMWSPFMDARRAGLGDAPKLTAMRIMEDTQEMKDIGLPDEVLNRLSAGASLAGAKDDLKAQLKDEYKINALASNLEGLQERGITIEDDLNAYIRNQDKYIKKLDRMIDSAKEYRITADIGNPYVRQSSDRYLNYLSILKGRQQQRYVGFLNTGINYHNAEITRATNDYKSAFSSYQEVLKDEGELTTEAFNYANTFIEEMSKSLNEREKNELQMYVLRENALEAQQGIFDITTNSGDTSGWSERTSEQKGKAQAKYIASRSDEVSEDEAMKEWAQMSGAQKQGFAGKTDDDVQDVDYYVKQLLTEKDAYMSSREVKDEKGNEKTIYFADISKVPAGAEKAVDARLRELNGDKEKMKKFLDKYDLEMEEGEETDESNWYNPKTWPWKWKE